MSTFNATVAEQLTPEILSEFGETVTYKPRNDDDVSLTGKLDPATTEEAETEQGTAWVYQRMLKISTDIASTHGGVATPTPRDLVEIDSQDWAVVDVDYLRGNAALLTLQREAAVELSGPDYEG